MLKLHYLLIQKMEENSSNDIREQRNLLENYKNTSVKFEETLKEKEEANTLRQRDLENKIIQERLRLDQKMKDLSKIGIIIVINENKEINLFNIYIKAYNFLFKLKTRRRTL